MDAASMKCSPRRDCNASYRRDLLALALVQSPEGLQRPRGRDHAHGRDASMKCSPRRDRNSTAAISAARRPAPQ